MTEDDETGRTPSLAEFAAAMQLSGQNRFQVGLIGKESPDFVKRLGPYDPLKLAATFAGLLTLPGLQSNCPRLELLVHQALACGKGAKNPDASVVRAGFNCAEQGYCGRFEDAAEDVFVRNITSTRGNFRIIEGVRESATFYLQRVVNVVEAMPDVPVLNDIRESIFALLQLSDAVCNRAGFVRYELGETTPLEEFPAQLNGKVGAIRRRVQFSEGELASLGINPDDLLAFVFDPRQRVHLLDDTYLDSGLDRHPVAWKDKTYFLVLPTSVSVAIRLFVVEEMDRLNSRDAFLGNLAKEYGDTFASTPLLGGPVGAEIVFQRTGAGLFAGVSQAVDRGRYLNFVFALDDMEGIQKDGLSGMPPDPEAIGADLNLWIDHAYADARERPGFLGGVSLVVCCGIGRGQVSFLRNSRPDWRVVAISAADFQTLSLLSGFKPLSLWRLLDAQIQVGKSGLALQNINGLLNLVAWMRSLDGHLIPHGTLPDDFVEDGVAGMVLVPQDLLRDLREEVARDHDPHAAQDTTGLWQCVSRYNESLFEEDNAKPLYVSHRFGPDGPLGALLLPERAWWFSVSLPATAPGALCADYWRMVSVWMSNAAPVLEAALNSLGPGPVHIAVEFAEAVESASPSKRLTFAEASADISVTADRAQRRAVVAVGPLFDQATHHEENIAERALVGALIEGAAMLAGEMDKVDGAGLLAEIVRNPQARHRHAFYTTDFRDYVRDSVPSSPLVLDSIDDATLKIGMGWRVRDRSLGPDIEGKEACTKFLGALVAQLEGELCEELKQFSRRALIRLLLQNHEAAAIETQHWRRTSAAMIGLHDDRAAALSVMAEHSSKMSAVFQTSRLLIEMAICECPTNGGRVPGILDVTRLMAKMGMVFHFGGWSDAIRWDVMEPKLRVTPFGDVHGNLGYIEDVFEPYARAASDVRVDDAIESYGENFENDDPEPNETEEPTLDAKFGKALADEFGAPLEHIQAFLDFIDVRAIDAGRAVLEVTRSELLAMELPGQSLDRDTSERLIDFLTFRPRQSWREIPEGYEARDRQPWRFRRRLSVLRKPLVRIDDGDDPKVLLAPGLVRDSVRYMIGNYYRADFPQAQLKPAMLAWKSATDGRRGSAFAADLAKWLEGIGWKTEVEIKITKILGKTQRKDFGDVDVLAWHEAENRILAIECKDVQYRKTYGEIAEQLSEFRGELRSNGKPDYLKLHLDRITLLSDNIDRIRQFLSMPNAARVESHLMFKNPVPMKFALERMRERVAVHVFRGLEGI